MMESMVIATEVVIMTKTKMDTIALMRSEVQTVMTDASFFLVWLGSQCSRRKLFEHY